jgi:hypothetical protein
MRDWYLHCVPQDGYEMFSDCPVLIGEEGGVLIPTALRNHFRTLEILNRFDPKVKVKKFAQHWIKKALPGRVGSSEQVDSTGSNSGSSGDLSPNPSSVSLEALPARNSIVEGELGSGYQVLSMSCEHLLTYDELVGGNGLCIFGERYSVAPILDGRIRVANGL